MNTDDRTVWVGNLSERVTEELLFELFLQAAPIERVRIPTDKEGRKSNFAFITFKHDKSVDYAVQLLNGISLFDKRLIIKPRNGAQPPQRNNEQHVRSNNMMHNYKDLLNLGELMHLNYNPPNYNQNNWHQSKEQNSFRDVREDRRKDDFKPYKHHEVDNRYGSRNFNSQSRTNNHHQGRTYNDQRMRRHRY